MKKQTNPSLVAETKAVFNQLMALDSTRANKAYGALLGLLEWTANDSPRTPETVRAFARGVLARASLASGEETTAETEGRVNLSYRRYMAGESAVVGWE